MTSTTRLLSPTLNADVDSIMRDLQQEILLWLLPIFSVAGLLLALHEGSPAGLSALLSPGLVLHFWPMVVWILRKQSYLLSAWALILGCTAVIIGIAIAENASIALCLLALPVGLAALLISMPAGLSAAIGATIVLYGAHGALLPADNLQWLVATLEVWCTLGLVWLTLRPVVTAMQWSWSSFERSRDLLEQSRDNQLRLKQTLADLADANTQLTRLNHLAQDLRKAAEDARRAKEQFVANVSHELRTPLNMIIGYAELIQRAPQVYGTKVPPALLADLSVILRNSRHLANLVDDVLDLSQMEAGQMTLTKELVSLCEIVEASVEAVRPLFSSKGIGLDVEIDAGIRLVCDRTRIRQVFLNLLSNAGRFTEQGSVKLQARREGDDVLVSIADTGPGIAREDQEKLFKPFQQVDGSIRRRHGGTGLGLSISKHFVELHEGTMWLESAVGVGTTVFFRLPVESATLPAASAPRWLSQNWNYEPRTRRSLAPMPSIRPRLVVVERGESLQRLLKRHYDAEIAPATDLEEAIHGLAKTPAQALLLNAPAVGRSFEDLGAREDLPNGLPVVVCSIAGPHEAATALGACDYLTKPISSQVLLATLDRLQVRGNRILVADDDPEALRLFWRMLASSGRGYRVMTATDGREAERILRAERPDALLLDLVMPGMDGFQLLAAKRQDPTIRDIPVVVMSARDPAGQPVVSNGLAVTRGGGLSLPQVLACIQGFTGCLAEPAEAGGPRPTATLPG